jgi:hypothetical protein
MFLIIKKKDINSIFPIIINNIINNLELVSKLLKSIAVIPYNPDIVVFVRVRKDNLNEFSKLISSISNTDVKISKLMKKDIKIKKESLIFSLFIFFSENKIF